VPRPKTNGDAFKATLAGDTWKSNNENVFVATPPDGANPRAAG